MQSKLTAASFKVEKNFHFSSVKLIFQNIEIKEIIKLTGLRRAGVLII